MRPRCCATAHQPEEKKGKPARTHWDMLLERRSTAELEEVLAERLAVLHDHQGKVKAALKQRARQGQEERLALPRTTGPSPLREAARRRARGTALVIHVRSEVDPAR